jgi:hypothetical protein
MLLLLSSDKINKCDNDNDQIDSIIIVCMWLILGILRSIPYYDVRAILSKNSNRSSKYLNTLHFYQLSFKRVDAVER